MPECPDCGNVARFRSIVMSQKIYIEIFDEENELVENNLESSKNFGTYICAECGSMILDEDSQPKEERVSAKKEDKKYLKKTTTTLSSKSKQNPISSKSQGSGQTRRPPTGGEESDKPTEKQIKYLQDLADKLGLQDEEKEGLNGLSKKEMSDKLTELFKECKRRGIE